MKLITPENVAEIIKKIGVKNFCANPIYLTTTESWYQETADDLITAYDNETLIFPTRTASNLLNRQIWCAYAEDIEEIKSRGVQILKAERDADEYFYLTQNFIDFLGPNFKQIRKEINFFKKNYNYSIKNDFPASLVKKFIDRWHQENVGKKSGYNLETFEKESKRTLKALDLLPRLKTVKTLYLTINNELAGFSWFAPTLNDFWVAIIQKVDHIYKGIGHVLYHEKSKLMKDYPLFSNGDDGQDKALADHKKRLNPTFIKETYIITTGGMIK